MHEGKSWNKFVLKLIVRMSMLLMIIIHQPKCTPHLILITESLVFEINNVYAELKIDCFDNFKSDTFNHKN